METPLEHILMTFFKEDMISFLNSHPEYFKEAIELAVSDKQPLSWRAAWLLHSCTKKNDNRIKNHVKSIIKTLPTKKDGHQRELIKILFIMELKEEDEGVLFDICVTLWENVSKRPSVRYTAMMFILKIAEKYPDLTQEIILLLQDQYLETLSPGIRYSIYRMKKGLGK